MADADKAADGGTPHLRRGWTTGSCATAATRAAFEGLVGGHFPDPVTVTLPGGQTPAFALAITAAGDGWTRAGVVKDAGDDPDVTHGALVVATVRPAAKGAGLVFRAGPGVGTVTRPGLPLAVGEPAINPVPRAMIARTLDEARAILGGPEDIEVEISVDNGEKLAERTLNGRLGIVGGLSILGTTGIVVPFSCAAWIASIQRGIDVARASGFSHVAAATGNTSEQAVKTLHGLDDVQLIDMGDFVGGTLKYLRKAPVPRVTLALGFAKGVKLGQGLLDLHSKRGSVDLDALSAIIADLGGGADLVRTVSSANTALEALTLCRAAGIPIAEAVAERGFATAAALIAGSGMALEVALFDRSGGLLASTGFRKV
ncbi:putative cobalt-precorrin-6A synthase (deacetylating) [uncultured Pleomorphomonas sp.]|uniref:Cobalt-precorrin-5B C(1)-methyltransferase n=1 Tax=uncultured Pleomorphomonas sp. TaxID=442121 RepID=A0A212LJV3_9HYPH|nr:cobalt-precorrin-5B (C(1))-methyltransferase [uncultured Pleomorphomonas sp.]SCM77831.1 putative cobalt-precorrin-6A synthase (deacetylating) [uncultured Pleomorphomonas sp.]